MTKLAEQIFDQEARKLMIQYDLNSFKKRYRTLYKVIINSMIKYRSQINK